MVSFRRLILALAVLALFTGLASAQVVGGGTSGGGSLTCAANVTNPTQARAEGWAELLGDIVIQCTGGTALASGTTAPTANVTVALGTSVTSKILASGNVSEALLLIDEPGSVQTTPTPGTLAPQTVCSSAAIGAGVGGCGPLTVNATGNAVSGATIINVFQGVVSGNTVIFNGVPIVPPATAGFTRVFRIVNIRANASQFAGTAGSLQGTIPIQAFVAITNGVTVTNSQLNAAYLYTGMGTPVIRSQTGGSGTPVINGLLQCATSGLSAGAVLRFTEGFAAAYKTRVNPTTAYSGSLIAGNSPFTGAITQNTPGQFSPGSESGFILAANGGTAGLADFGTRLKATFNNVPTGINLFVTTTNLSLTGAVNQSASTATNTYNTTAQPVGINTLAGLVLSETSTSAQGGFLPLASATNNSSGTLLFGPLPVDANGTATAVWEVLAANPNAFDSFEFGVWFSYTGNPATNTPPTTPAGTVSFSFAPTFTSVSASGLVPRFTPPSTSSTLISVALCQTTLLYPFVNSTPGFDTGLAIANTTSDPFSTRAQAGTCRLNFYGSGAGTTTFQDTPNIPTGTVWSDQTSNIRNGFAGYVIAVCNFQLAHGYALFSDTGIRNWATGYLALVLPTGTAARNTQNLQVGPGSTGAVEGTGH